MFAATSGRLFGSGFFTGSAAMAFAGGGMAFAGGLCAFLLFSGHFR
jgi:hypothetical protein